jgi:hypothetical protein
MSIAIYADTDWESAPPEANATEDGWDTLTRHEIISAVSLNAAVASYTKGASDTSFANMHLVDVKAKHLVTNLSFYEMELGYKGILEDKPVKYKFVTLSERNSYKNITFAGYLATPGAGDVAEPRIGVVARWISTTQPSMAIVGTAVTPDLAPTPPDSVWDSIPSDQIIRNIPKWWVLDARMPEQIPGTNVWLVEDTFSFYQTVKPSK